MVEKRVMSRRIWVEMLLAVWIALVFAAYLVHVILPKIQGKI